VPLLRRSFPAWSVHPFDQRDEGPPPVFGYGWLADAPAVDHHAEIGSLPGLLGLGLATPPARSAYLIPDPTRRDALGARYRSLGPGPIVGLTWRSRNRIHGQAKNLEIADVAAIVRARPDAVFVSLQYGAHQGDREALERLGARIHVDRDVDALSDLDAHLAQIAAVELRRPLGYAWQEAHTGVNTPKNDGGGGNARQSDDMRRKLAPPKPRRPLKNL
jgi:hypothetical protein